MKKHLYAAILATCCIGAIAGAAQAQSMYPAQPDWMNPHQMLQRQMESMEWDSRFDSLHQPRPPSAMEYYNQQIDMMIKLKQLQLLQQQQRMQQQGR